MDERGLETTVPRYYQNPCPCFDCEIDISSHSPTTAVQGIYLQDLTLHFNLDFRALSIICHICSLADQHLNAFPPQTKIPQTACRTHILLTLTVWQLQYYVQQQLADILQTKSKISENKTKTQAKTPTKTTNTDKS